MKNQDFFEAIAAQGLVQALHASLAEQPNYLKMFIGRLERLEEEHKAAGSELTENLFVSKNQLAHSIFSILGSKDLSAESGDFIKIRRALSEHLGISEESEKKLMEARDAGMAQINERQKAEALLLINRPATNYEPVPTDELLPQKAINDLLGSGQLLLALRHSLTLAKDDKALPSIKILMTQYKELEKGRLVGVLDKEAIGIAENRLIASLQAILDKLDGPPEAPKKNFWQKLWS